MRKALRRIGIGLGALLGLVVVAGGVMYLVGSSRVDRTYEVALARLVPPTDAAGIARGAHLARIHGCTDCHGADLSGQVFVDAPPFRVVAANLTSGRGGVGARYSDADFDRAIRHGVKPDGRPVFIMPSAAFHAMSDDDAAALIAYLRSVPPVDRELPATEVRAPGRLLAAVALDPAMEVRTGPARAGSPPPAGPTAEYGEYLASITCAYCHGENLRGNPAPPQPGSPPAPDLAAAGGWTLEQFAHALRTGERPAAAPLDPKFMPYPITAAMSDDELRALHAYFGTLASR